MEGHHQIITISFLLDSLSHPGIKSDGFPQMCATIKDYCLLECDAMYFAIYDSQSNENFRDATEIQTLLFS
jgi:hypothetical protein